MIDPSMHVNYLASGLVWPRFTSCISWELLPWWNIPYSRIHDICLVLTNGTILP